MAVTTAANLIIPDVWADLAMGALKSNTRFLASAVTRDDLQGRPGDTIHFPKWTVLTDMEDLTENVPMAPEALSQTVGAATIKEAGKAVEFTDTADLAGLGSTESEAVRQFGILTARKLDADLYTAALAETNADPSTKTREQKPRKASISGTTISWPGIVDAIAAFGDEWEPSDFSGLYIRSDQMAALMKDDQFINASKLGKDTPVATGQIGTIGGVPVIVTNRVATGKFLLMQHAALGLLYKRRPVVETDRDILKRTTVVTTNVHYAVKRLKDDGVLVATLGA